MNNINNKRKRATNFSFSEKELLLKIALSKKTVLENKSSNAVTWKDKEKMWEKIATDYNSQTPGSPRSAICLKQKYENIKKDMRGNKSRHFVTGGGPAQNVHEPSSDYEVELFRTIQVSVEGIPCVIDSDTISTANLNGISVGDNVCDPLLVELEDFKQNMMSDVINYENEAEESVISLNIYDVPSTSTWVPADAVKCLKNNSISDKLCIDSPIIKTKPDPSLKRKKLCHSSASEKIIELTKEKAVLVEMQEELVRQELLQIKEMHDLKMKHARAEHELRMSILQLEYDIKKKQLF